MRTLIAIGGLATLHAALPMASPGHAQACPDTFQNGEVRQLSAEALARAPLRLAIPAGGEPDLADCPEPRGAGFVTMQPDLTLRLTESPLGRRLQFRVESDCDAVMLVNTPSNQWRFDDDSNGNYDPAIGVDRARAGWWDVWLGRLGDGPGACPATLVVSAGPPARQQAAIAPGGYRTTGYRK